MSEADSFLAFRAKFQVEDLLVAQTHAWSWSVRPQQPTLGAGIVSLNRPASQLSHVTTAEMAEFATLIQKAEKAVKATFTYDIMNYLMLMLVDRHVHFHVIPRYSGARFFSGVEWVDKGWPNPPVMSERQHEDQKGLLMRVRDALKVASGES